MRRVCTIDGLPGFASVDRGRVLQTTALELRDGRIVAIYIVRNPDKLRHVAAALAVEQGVVGGGAKLDGGDSAECPPTACDLETCPNENV